MAVSRLSRRAASLAFTSSLATIGLMSLAAPAFAQDAGAPDPTAEPAASTEIIVTAQFRQQNLQDTPLAITAVNAEMLEARSQTNIAEVAAQAPSVTLKPQGAAYGPSMAANIRGVGQYDFNPALEPGVGLYVDDVYYSRIASATLDFLDVAQIEVLRGPQGTLYGKNTTAGAINITTHQPTFALEGKAEVSIGNLGFKQAKAAISGPLSDTVAARVALSSTNRRGTVYNVATRNWVNEQDNLGLRGQILWEPSGMVDVTLTGDYSRQDPECCTQIYVRTGLTQRGLDRQYEALAAAQNYAVPSTDPFDRLTDVDADLNAGNTIGGASLRVRWDTGGGNLTAITAWRFWDWLPASDRDFTGLPITTVSQNPSQQNQFTQELRYSHSFGRLDLLLGAFAFHQTGRTQGSQVQGPAASRWLISPSNPLAHDPSVLEGLTATNDIRLDNTSAALFGQAGFRLTDTLTIQPGFRLNYDRKNGLYESVVTNGDGDLVTFGSTDPRIVAQRGVLAPQRFEPSFSDWNISYDLTANWQPVPDLLVYATYARTFKPGGVNLNGVPNDAAGNPIVAVGTVAPEKVSHYEAGLKTQLPGGWGSFNLAAYRTDISDYQALVVNGQTGVLRGYLANADAVRTQGVEWDFTVRPSERFSTYFGGAWTDATYRRFTDAPCPPELSGGTAVAPGQIPGAPGVPGSLSPANCDISGQRLPGVSKWALSFGAEANLPASLLGEEGEIYLAYDGSYRSHFSSNPTPSAYTWVDGYHLSNLRLGFRGNRGISTYLWVRNLFDENYFEQLAVPSGNTGLIAGQTGDPRTYGLTLSYRH